MLCCIIFYIILFIFESSRCNAKYVNKNHPKPNQVRYYPKNSYFQKSDLIDMGCVVFLRKCPAPYKRETVCARHYDGYYKTFNNYCDLEYENCNSWRQWSMIKRSRC